MATGQIQDAMRQARTDAARRVIEECLKTGEKASVRRIAQRLGVSHSTSWRLLRELGYDFDRGWKRPRKRST